MGSLLLLNTLASRFPTDSRSEQQLAFLNHCCQVRHYTFCIKKSGKDDCSICKLVRMNSFVTFAFFQWSLTCRLTEYTQTCQSIKWLKSDNIDTCMTTPNFTPQNVAGLPSCTFYSDLEGLRLVVVIWSLHCGEGGAKVGQGWLWVQ